MTFKELVDAVMERFSALQKTHKPFTSAIGGDKLYTMYLAGIEGDHVFRDPSSSVHTCNTCNNFFRRYANIVFLSEDLEIESPFDIENAGPYQEAVNAITKAHKSNQIASIFRESFNALNALPYEKCSKHNSTFQLGTAKNFKIYSKDEVDKYPGKVNRDFNYEFWHFHVFLDAQFVDMSEASLESIYAEANTRKQLFEKGMKVDAGSYELFAELAQNNAIMNSTQHVSKLQQYAEMKKEYDSLPEEKKELYLWHKSGEIGEFSRFISSALGTSIQEYAGGDDLEKVCRAYNQRIDPANYMKAASPITEGQKKLAEKFFIENGYIDSLERRFATMSDIDTEEIVHINESNKAVKTASVFSALSTKNSSEKIDAKNFESVSKVSIDEFMKEILPSSTLVEVLFESRHSDNMAVLTTTKDITSKSMFMWSNPFSWTNISGLAGKSEISKNVQAKGGKVDGVVRCSLQWNDDQTPGAPNCDLDLHCDLLHRDTGVYFGNRKDISTGLTLDVDIQRPSTQGINGVAVENITTDKQLPDGSYKFFVKNFNSQTNSGFTLELAIDGMLYTYKKRDIVKGILDVATLVVKNGSFTVIHHIPVVETGSIDKTVWGIDTNKFHQVSLVCQSPNYWGENNVGNKHYMFNLHGCKTDAPIRAFHSENLANELKPYRKVLDMLGNKILLEPVDNQLAGLAFNSTVRDNVIVRVTKKNEKPKVMRVEF